jgi:hypothetical protein
MRVNIPDCAATTAHELLCNVGVTQQVAAKTGVFQQTDEPTAKLMKGTNGRNNSGPDGDLFRDFITHREPAGFTEKSHPGMERE